MSEQQKKDAIETTCTENNGDNKTFKKVKQPKEKKQRKSIIRRLVIFIAGLIMMALGYLARALFQKKGSDVPVENVGAQLVEEAAKAVSEVPQVNE